MEQPLLLQILTLRSKGLDSYKNVDLLIQLQF